MAKKAKKAKKVAKRAAAIPTPATIQRRNRELMARVAEQPLHTISAEDKLRMPLHACLDNGPNARCTLMRYNPRTRQYDIDEGDIDCALCTHFVQPVQ